MALLDNSKVGGGNFQGLELELHRFSGARALRVIHPGAQDIDEHKHDWAYIGLYTAGRYIEQYDGGSIDMSLPCAVFHPQGRPHSDTIGSEGLETLTLEFEPSWLRFQGIDRRFDRSLAWLGGAVAMTSRRLARRLSDPASTEAAIGQAVRGFFDIAFHCDQPRKPEWVANALAAVRSGTTSGEIARRLDLNPAWMARAYRNTVGEGLHETARRIRVERASALLRQTRAPLAEIAIDSGFCDQSHMNRCFRAVLGRSPLQVRREVAPWA